MKKIILTCMLMLVAALSAQAQSLTGKQWCTVLNDEDGEGIAVALTFEKDGSCEMVIAAQQEMKEEGVPVTLMAGVTVPGTYKRDGNDLNTIKKEFRKVLLGGMPKMDHLKIVSLAGKKLVLKNTDNQEIPFYAE